MKKVLVFLILIVSCLAFSGVCWASGTAVEIPTEQGCFYMTSENIAALTTGVTGFAGLSAAQRVRFREAHVQNTKGDAVRYRIDGTGPTTTVGLYLGAGTAVVIKDYESWAKFQAIADSAGTGASLFGIVYGK